MLIEPEMRANGDLVLTAYTFDASERDSLEVVLLRAGVPPLGSVAPPDSTGRPATRYIVPSNRVSSFGATIGGEFSPMGFQPRGGGRNTFACQRIAGLTGLGGTCESFQADDMAAARVTCALLARELQWFGGVPRPGPCP